MQQYFVHSGSPRPRIIRGLRCVFRLGNGGTTTHLAKEYTNTRASDWWSPAQECVSFAIVRSARSRRVWRGQNTFANQLQALRTMVVTDRYHQPIYEAKSHLSLLCVFQKKSGMASLHSHSLSLFVYSFVPLNRRNEEKNTWACYERFKTHGDCS
jgi:hypothetical protein